MMLTGEDASFSVNDLLGEDLSHGGDTQILDSSTASVAVRMLNAVWPLSSSFPPFPGRFSRVKVPSIWKADDRRL